MYVTSLWGSVFFLFSVLTDKLVESEHIRGHYLVQKGQMSVDTYARREMDSTVDAVIASWKHCGKRNVSFELQSVILSLSGWE